MKAVVAIVGFSCLLAIALTSVQAGNPRPPPPPPQTGGAVDDVRNATAGLVDDVANATAELVRNLLVVVGSITEGVQMILDGVCEEIFDIYQRVIYPLLDCLTAILGIQDALCGISDSKCIRELLIEAAAGRNRTLGDDLIGISGGIKIKVELGVSGRIGKRGADGQHRPPGHEPTEKTIVREQGGIERFLCKYPEGSTDRKYAILALKLLALAVEIILYLAVRVHLPVLLLCPEQRREYGFDKEEIACPFPKDGTNEGQGKGGNSNAGQSEEKGSKHGKKDTRPPKAK